MVWGIRVQGLGVKGSELAEVLRGRHHEYGNCRGHAPHVLASEP